MKFIDEYRDKTLCDKVLDDIHASVKKEIRIMEVCGTHTASIFRYGLRDLLPDNIKLLSGPGCPVCVTSQKEIDKSIALARQDNTIIATYGDMLRVPGSESSLEKERTAGRDIRIIYSALDAIKFAEDNPDSNVVFLGVGFETTAPATAVSIMEADKKNLKNYSTLCCHKLITPAMRILLESGDANIDGFLCPGHVSAILGSEDYMFIADEYKTPCVIAGFEPLDVLESIRMLIHLFNSGKPAVEIQYSRCIKPKGNQKAKTLLFSVFEPEDTIWRGLGVIPESGLKLKDQFSQFDSNRLSDLSHIESEAPPGCMCGDILKGIKLPMDCPLFGKKCTPERPIGPCMVSSEGTCGIYFKYDI